MENATENAEKHAGKHRTTMGKRWTTQRKRLENTRVHICTHVYICVRMCTHVYTCVHMCTHVYTYLKTYCPVTGPAFQDKLRAYPYDSNGLLRCDLRRLK